ncbi:hypothetical protein, partial [Parafrankia sp. BMG5.11]|uniref:hypothetical protein n=1 Tax=Parafrankia sp. BMG5.11 TaxID=222540 RepID=UPI001A9D5158
MASEEEVRREILRRTGTLLVHGTLLPVVVRIPSEARRVTQCSRRAGLATGQGGRPATRSRHDSRLSRMAGRAVGWSGSSVAWPGGCKSEQFRDRLVAVVFRGLF